MNTSTSSSPTRVIALDGALLAFDRSTGDRWLLRSPATRALRAEAPPLVLFSITNACNLTCAFCYRDQRRESAWTVDSAFDLLAGLDERGALEVAFGGGEPFVFKGFATLVERLRRQTSLVVHATTNGTAITREVARRLRGHFGELRLSIYDDAPWRERFAMLTGEGHSVGLHYLVTPERLPGLRAFVEGLVALGAKKLFLLSYNGPDRRMHLGRAASDELAHTINSLDDLPIEVGVSACWGARLDPVAQLSPDRGDCGAGSHFVSIGPDATLSPCSFHHQRRAARTCDEALEAWRAMRSPGPARIQGCHRRSLIDRPSDGLWRWRAWSGNNSVDCFTVGRFVDAPTAAEAIEELRALIERPGPDLYSQANAVLNEEIQRIVRGERDPRRVRALIAEGSEARERWLDEVLSWQTAPNPVASYAESLSIAPGALRLPQSVEQPTLVESFGSLAFYLQGTTLAPFNDLAALWVYRGGRVYDLARAATWRLSVLWAARCESEDDAQRHASQLSAVARGRGVWGISDVLNTRRAERTSPPMEWLRAELEDRGLPFDGVAIAGYERSTADVARLVAELASEPNAIPSRLIFAASDAVADEALRSLRELDADPSKLVEWAGRKIEGSRRWPKELRTHRWGRASMVEAERLPNVVGRGLLRRATATPYSIDARVLRATIAVYDATTTTKARTMLRGLGLTLVNAEDETDTRGYVTGIDATTQLDRIAPALERKSLPWELLVEPEDELRSGLEYLQRKLSIRFE